MLNRLAPPIGWLLALCLVAMQGAAAAANSGTAQPKVDFNREIRKIGAGHVTDRKALFLK